MVLNWGVEDKEKWREGGRERSKWEGKHRVGNGGLEMVAATYASTSCTRFSFTCGRVKQSFRETSDQQLHNCSSVIVHIFSGAWSCLATNTNIPTVGQ